MFRRCQQRIWMAIVVMGLGWPGLSSASDDSMVNTVAAETVPAGPPHQLRRINPNIAQAGYSGGRWQGSSMNNCPDQSGLPLHMRYQTHRLKLRDVPDWFCYIKGHGPARWIRN